MSGIWNPANWPPGSNGGMGNGANPMRELYSENFAQPNSADFAVNNLAADGPDAVNAGINSRSFPTAGEPGVAWSTRIPAGAVNLVLSNIMSRSDGTAGNWVPRLYARSFPDNVAVTAWSVKLLLTAIVIPANTRWQYATQTIALSLILGGVAAAGLAAGDEVQFQLTRNNGGEAGDTLAALLSLRKIGFQFT